MSLTGPTAAWRGCQHLQPLDVLGLVDLAAGKPVGEYLLRRRGLHAERDEADDEHRHGGGVQAPGLAFHGLLLPVGDVVQAALPDPGGGTGQRHLIEGRRSLPLGGMVGGGWWQTRGGSTSW